MADSPRTPTGPPRPRRLLFGDNSDGATSDSSSDRRRDREKEDTTPRTPSGPPSEGDDLEDVGRVLMYLGPKATSARLVRVGNLLRSLRCRTCMAPCEGIGSHRVPRTQPERQEDLGWKPTEYRVFYAERVEHAWDDPYKEPTERQRDLPGFACNAPAHPYARLLPARDAEGYRGSPLFVARVELGREKIVDCTDGDLEFLQDYLQSTYRTLHLPSVRSASAFACGGSRTDSGWSWSCNVL